MDYIAPALVAAVILIVIAFARYKRQSEPSGSPTRFRMFWIVFAVPLLTIGISFVLKMAPKWIEDHQMEEVKRKAEQDATRAVKEAVERAKQTQKGR